MDSGQCSWIFDDQIHIWKFPAIRQQPNLLIESEAIVADRFRFQGDRNRFTIGRHALRLLLSKYFSVAPELISVSAEKGRKPVVNNPSFQVHFNISHSGDWVLLVFAKQEVGIDIECIVPEFEFKDILNEYFNVQEQSCVFSSANPPAAFYYLWTRKESLIKAAGRGLQENIKQLDVLDKDSVTKIDSKVWKLMSFKLQESYPAALAYSHDPARILFFDGTDLLQG
jgi:4'-phosphopantetheinyl transferase